MPAPSYMYRIANGYQKAVAVIVGGIVAAANQIVATGADGYIDDSFIHPALVPAPVSLPATEALAASAQVNLWNSSGTESVRNADATTGRRSDGFVLAAVASGGTAKVYRRGGVNTGLTGLTVGSDYYLGVGGAVTTAQNGTSGQLDQPPPQPPLLNT